MAKYLDLEGLKYYHQKTQDEFAAKEAGKALSSNDYTTAEKNKLAGIAEGANKTVVDSALNSTSTNPVQNKVIINELEKIKELIKSSGSGTADNSTIEALETALEQVRNSIPTKTSQLENDDYTVKDDSYVHTDNNLTDQRTENLDNLKEVTAVEFSSTSPYWSGNTLTLQLAEHQYFIALYRSSENGSVLDVTTSCRQKDQQVIIDASAPFSGHIMVSGTIAYGDLNELLGIILNESVVYTYTLEDILGEPYKEPVYPDKEQLASTVTALQNCVNSLKESGGEILTQCNDVKAGCKDYFDLIAQRYTELQSDTSSTSNNGISITRIYANDDLNNYLESGFYACPSGNDAATLTNMPTGFTNTFFMLVLKCVLNFQIMWEYRGTCMYIRSNDRYSDTDHWGAWMKYTGTAT